MPQGYLPRLGQPLYLCVNGDAVRIIIQGQNCSEHQLLKRSDVLVAPHLYNSVREMFKPAWRYSPVKLAAHNQALKQGSTRKCP